MSHAHRPFQPHLRRPWSPDPYDPLPVVHGTPYDLAGDANYGEWHTHPHRGATETSIEALDLADYAQTLRPNAHIDPLTGAPYAPSNFRDRYPPRPIPRLPSLDSLAPPPSLISAGCLTSSSHSRSYQPPPSSSARARTRRETYPNATSSRSAVQANPHIVDPEEIDVSHFPAWSRNWYHQPRIPAHAALHDEPEPFFFGSSQHGSGTSPTKQPNPWDPGYTPQADPFHPQPYLSHFAHTHTAPSAETARDLLPWSADPPQHGPPIDAEVKEERVRMLEREFGRGRDAAAQEDNKPLVGTIDHKGQLVTQGPKKRIALRVVEALLALVAAVPSIYVALAVKPQEPAPPAAKAPAFALYILSVLTSLLLIYLFVLRPCCAGRRDAEDHHATVAAAGGLPGALAVLPIGGLPGAQTKKDKKRNKADRYGSPQHGGAVPQDVHVNLIVDPGLLGGSRGGGAGRDNDDDDYDADDDRRSDTDPSGWSDSQRFRGYARRQGDPPRCPRRPRRSIFVGLAEEARWKQVRAWLKTLLLIDICGVVLWGGLFVFILFGKRCPIGQFEGWCTGYNGATAAACLLCVCFGLSTFLDIKDLHSSRVSPRTR